MSILSPNLDPYLRYLAQEKKRMLPPWTSSDPALLTLAKNSFPEVPIYGAEQFGVPELMPVEILPMEDKGGAQDDDETYFIAVGGPPAAAVALQAAKDGKPVLYISDTDLYRANKVSLPIWTGAGNHGEPDAYTEAPAYVLGYQPLRFILSEILRLFLPPFLKKKVTDPDYPWLSLNFREWLMNPRQWLAGLRVTWGNHRLAKEYAKDCAAGVQTTVLDTMIKRAQESGSYLEKLNQSLTGLLRSPRGSLIVASSPQQVESLTKAAGFLAKENRPLLPLTPEEAKEKYGIQPRGAYALREKTHDFIFEPGFLNTLTQGIQAEGGQVISHWRLTRVFVDTVKNQGGMLEFYELNEKQEKVFHYRKFSQAHLSLGPTPYRPNCYDLISVTGVTINALLFGVTLRGGPIVCGGANHLVPLLPPRSVQMGGHQHPEDVNFVRLSTGASVNPLNRGKNWYHYDSYHARNLLHRVQETLPPEARLKILSVRGCNRVIGKDARQVELHPVISVKNQKFRCETVTIQIGAGGGGLTQMGAVPGNR